MTPAQRRELTDPPHGKFEQGQWDEIAEQLIEVWPESHWPGFALRQSDVLQTQAT